MSGSQTSYIVLNEKDVGWKRAWMRIDIHLDTLCATWICSTIFPKFLTRPVPYLIVASQLQKHTAASAKANYQITGFVAMTVRPGKSQVFVEVVCSHRGGGVELMKQVFAFAKERQVHTIHLEPLDHSIQFYTRLGFEYDTPKNMELQMVYHVDREKRAKGIVHKHVASESDSDTSESDSDTSESDSDDSNSSSSSTDSNDDDESIQSIVVEQNTGVMTRSISRTLHSSSNSN
jgi:N-acetylglutamate synthase-like GNAT family acetyltransferase